MTDDEFGCVAYEAMNASSTSVAWGALEASLRALWVGVARAVRDEVAAETMDETPSTRINEVDVDRLNADLAAARADAKAAHERTRLVNECHLAAFRALGGR